MSERMSDERLAWWKQQVRLDAEQDATELLDALIAERAGVKRSHDAILALTGEVERLRSQVDAACASPEGCADRDHWKRVAEGFAVEMELAGIGKAHLLLKAAEETTREDAR